MTPTRNLNSCHAACGARTLIVNSARSLDGSATFEFLSRGRTSYSMRRQVRHCGILAFAFVLQSQSVNSKRTSITNALVQHASASKKGIQIMPRPDLGAPM